ncbi:unnamed protein product [Phaeothamnion confervicola]
MSREHSQERRATIADVLLPSFATQREKSSTLHNSNDATPQHDRENTTAIERAASTVSHRTRSKHREPSVEAVPSISLHHSTSKDIKRICL